MMHPPAKNCRKQEDSGRQCHFDLTAANKCRTMSPTTKLKLEKNGTKHTNVQYLRPSHSLSKKSARVKGDDLEELNLGGIEDPKTILISSELEEDSKQD